MNDMPQFLECPVSQFLLYLSQAGPFGNCEWNRILLQASALPPTLGPRNLEFPTGVRGLIQGAPVSMSFSATVSPRAEPAHKDLLSGE